MERVSKGTIPRPVLHFWRLILDIFVTRLSPRHKKKPPKANAFRDLLVLEMAGVTGLEPAASGVTGRRSNQLSYTPGSAGLRACQCPPPPKSHTSRTSPINCQAAAGSSQLFFITFREADAAGRDDHNPT